jgi:hypothetical protein
METDKEVAAWATLKADHETKQGCKLFTVIVPETDFDPETRVLVKRPSKQLWRRIKAMHADENQAIDADEALVRECMVYPAFDSIADERPGLVMVVSAQISIAAGAIKGATAKK